jgi:TPR repeat protein
VHYESMSLAVLSAKASGGDALAQRTLGIHYLSHETLLAEGQEALQAREQRAAAGAATDADARGLTVLSGLHTDACEALGAEWLEKSALQDDPEVRLTDTSPGET